MKRKRLPAGILLCLSLSFTACGTNQAKPTETDFSAVSAASSADSSKKPMLSVTSLSSTTAADFFHVDGFHGRLNLNEGDTFYTPPIRISGDADQKDVILKDQHIVLPESSVLLMQKDRWGDSGIKMVSQQEAEETRLFQFLTSVEWTALSDVQLNQADFLKMDSTIYAYLISAGGTYYDMTLHGYKDGQIHLELQQGEEATRRAFTCTSSEIHQIMRNLAGIGDATLTDLQNANEITYNSLTGTATLKQDEISQFKKLLSSLEAAEGNYLGGTAFDLHLSFNGKQADIATDAAGYLVIGDTTYVFKDRAKALNVLKTIFKDALWDGKKPS